MGKRFLYTIGHSNRSFDSFLTLLESFEVEMVIDVRTIPRSRHNPQYNQEELEKALKKAKVGYLHLKELGGLRRPQKESINRGWENSSFRGFADYMQSEEFEEGLATLIEVAKDKRVAILCAEAVPWRCHRSLIADALTVKKWKVYHIQSRKTAKLHLLTHFLKVEGKRLIYP